MCFRDLFNRLDVDGSGGISLEELSQGLEEQGYHVTPIEVEQLMARLDLDADGHIQMDEFAASMIDWKDVRSFCLKFMTVVSRIINQFCIPMPKGLFCKFEVQD